MNALFVESDEGVIDQLKDAIRAFNSTQIEILETVTTLEELSKRLSCKTKPDFIIADTQLPDGSTFDLLNHSQIAIPIIFISDKKNEVFEALKWNVIDFLIKPVKNYALINALKKHELLLSGSSANKESINYKERFLVKLGDRLQVVKVSEIAAFNAEDKVTFLLSLEKGRSYLIDHTLDDLDGHLIEPGKFFRINRQYIISVDAIENIKSYPNRRLKVELNVPVKEELVVSRDRVSDFKKWLDK